jgi:hypothetical protein
MKKILGIVLAVLLLGCQEDSEKSALAGTKWVGVDPDDAMLNYWSFGSGSSLDYYDGSDGSTHCFDHTVFTYQTDGDSLFLTATGMEMRARYAFVGDSLRLYAFDGYINLYETQFMADTLEACP